MCYHIQVLIPINVSVFVTKTFNHLVQFDAPFFAVVSIRQEDITDKVTHPVVVYIDVKFKGDWNLQYCIISKIAHALSLQIEQANLSLNHIRFRSKPQQ